MCVFVCQEAGQVFAQQRQPRVPVSGCRGLRHGFVGGYIGVISGLDQGYIGVISGLYQGHVSRPNRRITER